MDKIINVETMNQDIEDDRVDRNRLKKKRKRLSQICTKWPF